MSNNESSAGAGEAFKGEAGGCDAGDASIGAGDADISAGADAGTGDGAVDRGMATVNNGAGVAAPAVLGEETDAWAGGTTDETETPRDKEAGPAREGDCADCAAATGSATTGSSATGGDPSNSAASAASWLMDMPRD